MEDEFDRLMSILSGKAEEKEKQMDEIFQKCTDFFDKYKYVLTAGSLEEKEIMQKKMNILREVLKDENEKAQAKLGISHEEIRELSEDPKNFTKDQWEFLQNAQSKLFQENKSKNELELKVKNDREASLKLKSKKKPSTKKSDWMKS